MTSHLVAVATLALAILLSPETLVLGLILAGDRAHPRLAAWGFALGGIAGIAFATALGLWIAAASGADHPAPHGSWPGFLVRAVIAAVLLAIGLSRAAGALRHTPIPDTAAAERRPGRLRRALDAELTPGKSLLRGAAGGFARCGLHPKVFPIAIAAGHQISQINAPGEHALAIGVFAVISVLPALAPALIETVSPGASGRIKDGYQRIMQVHGRWVTAALLIAAAAFVGHNAWEKFPR